jgi:hypothetical protein
MTRTEVTYAQLDKALLALGYCRRIVDIDGDARVYEHNARPQATIVLPAFAIQDLVLDYHLAAVQTTLDLNGIADPSEFAARLKKAA